MAKTLVTNVVPEPTAKVAAVPTNISAAQVYAMFPEVSSDTMVTDLPAPIVNVLGVLNAKCSGDSVPKAVPIPAAIPVNSEPSPLNLVAVTIPV